MSLRKQVIKLAYDNPELREHLLPLMKTANYGHRMFKEIVDVRGWYDIQKALKAAGDEQSVDLLNDVRIKLTDALDQPPNVERALNRLSSLIGSHSRDPGNLRNQIFKIAHELGMRLPSSMFASEKQADLTLTPKDKKVLDAFTDKKPMEGTKLSTDGKSLDIAGLGGGGVAKWVGGKIELVDLGGRSSDVVHRAIRKIVPKNWLKQGAYEGHMDPDQERLFNNLHMRATNEGRFYNRRDAKGAVDFAFREYQKDRDRADREDFRIIKDRLEKAILEYWGTP
jgi:hypothetical protein